MLLKGIAIIAIFGFCYAEEHAYSSQSIVLHHVHKEHDDHKDEPVKVEVQKVNPVVEYVIDSSGYEHKHDQKHNEEHEHKEVPKYEHYNHKNAFSSQHIVHHHEHKEQDEHNEEHHIPVKVQVQEVLPVVKYVIESSGHEHQQEYKHQDQLEYKEEPKHIHIEQDNHKHAFSSQHIERHDIPAHPPKGWNEHHGPAKYEFEYKIHDPHTHDNKYQHEARDGHHVKGVYSLHEADGSVRTVHYTADKKAGFQADVQHTTKHVEEHKQHH